MKFEDFCKMPDLSSTEISMLGIWKAEREKLIEALGWILPMAKGYAAEHPVGNNQEIINEVNDILTKEEKP